MRHFLSLTSYHFVCFACSIGVYDGSQIYAVRHGCLQSLAINAEGMYGQKNKTKKRTAPAMCGSMSAFECFFQ